MSPLGNSHINVHGRYAFNSFDDNQLRRLRDPYSAGEDD